MFYCPHCDQSLRQLPSPRGAQWRCPQCEGRALSLAVSRRLLDKSFVNSLWQSARTDAKTSQTECPFCRNLLREVAAVGEDETLHLDVCISCHSLWFDTHELSNLETRVAAPTTEPETDPLPARAREAIALAKIEQIRRQADAENAGSSAPPSDWTAILAIFGVPVEENAPGWSRYPFITWLLALGMILTFLSQLIWFPEAYREWGFLPSAPLRHGGLTLLTGFFLHGSWLHLIANLAFLLTFGDNVEDYLNHRDYLALVLSASLLGDTLHSVLDPRGELPLIGASGGISGVIAFYAWQFPRARLVYLLRMGGYFRWVRFPAFWGFVAWIILQMGVVVQQTQGSGGVSGLAHFGGAMMGVIWWLIYRCRENRGAE